MNDNQLEIPLDLLKSIVLFLKGKDFINLCQTNKDLFNFCNSFPDAWWLTKFLHDYGPPNPRKPFSLT